MATAFFRTVILYLLLIAGLRITGKRQIGELEPIELVLTMLLSDLASVPMQDFGIPLVNGIVPIVTLLSLSMLLSYGSLRSVRFRTLLCGEPTLIIRSGHILQDAMRRNRLTVDELLEALRGQGISDLQEVKYAVLETSGQLSVLPRADCQPVTPRQLSLQPEDPQTLPTVVISDGRLLRRSMERLGLDDGMAFRPLRTPGSGQPREVFLLSVDEAGSVVCLPKDGEGMRRALILPTVTILLLLGLCIANGPFAAAAHGPVVRHGCRNRPIRPVGALAGGPAGNWTLWRQTGTKPRSICISWYTTAP